MYFVTYTRNDHYCDDEPYTDLIHTEFDSFDEAVSYIRQDVKDTIKDYILDLDFDEDEADEENNPEYRQAIAKCMKIDIDKYKEPVQRSAFLLTGTVYTEIYTYEGEDWNDCTYYIYKK